MLKNTTGAFNDGEQIKVIGSDAAAQVGVYSARDNFIRAYYGNTSGYPTADPTGDSNPLNDEKKANPRDDDVHWPPDELTDWSVDNDYFTLVQWDAVNTGVTLIGSVDEAVSCERRVANHQLPLFSRVRRLML